MSEAQIDFNAVADAAAEAEDQTKLPEGIKKVDIQEGRALLRLAGYEERGLRQPKKAEHKPAVQCVLTFELWGKKYVTEANGEVYPNQVRVYVNKGGAKSRYGRLFKAMNHNEQFKHFAQMVGNWSGVGDITLNGEYANLDKDGAWQIFAPVHECPIEGTRTPIEVPPLKAPKRVFLWENDGINDDQYLALWNDLFIDGSNEDGTSKNFIQNMIKEALDFKGSRLERLLNEGSSTSLEEVPIEDEGQDKGEAKEPAQETTEPAVSDEDQAAALAAALG